MSKKWTFFIGILVGQAQCVAGYMLAPHNIFLTLLVTTSVGVLSYVALRLADKDFY